MTENYIKLDIKSFQDMCKNITELTEENKSLRLDNDFLEKQNAACKLRCSKLSIQVRELESEIADMRFTRKYLTSEEAGRQFARELLGKPMTEADIAEEKAIIEGEQAYYEIGTALYGDDF